MVNLSLSPRVHNTISFEGLAGASEKKTKSLFNSSPSLIVCGKFLCRVSGRKAEHTPEITLTIPMMMSGTQTSTLPYERRNNKK